MNNFEVGSPRFDQTLRGDTQILPKPKRRASNFDKNSQNNNMYYLGALIRIQKRQTKKRREKKENVYYAF